MLVRTPCRVFGNLPVELSSFVGRRRELSEARRFLECSRLLTFTGVGGVGKTRLASRLAAEVYRSFPDGVWLVELAALQDERLLARTVAVALGLMDRSSQSPMDSLLDFVADKRLLLVLDNCEHLPEACAVLLERVLKSAGGVRVVATSREPLNVLGERVVEVPPLSLPGADRVGGSGLEEFEAVRLLVERARMVAPGFSVTEANREAVVDLCRRLDGIPLAIELAAVRLRALSVEQVLERLGDRFRLLTGGSRAALPRQRTLEATIDWSHDLCSAEERALWGRLSVFSGGFEPAAVEEVCRDEVIGGADVLDVLTGLVNKSVVIREGHDCEVRYRLLESIRQYGHDLLAKSGERTLLRRRHRDHYLSLSEQAQAAWLSPDQMRWLTRLQREQANLRVALEFCMSEPGQAQAGLELASGLWPHWLYTGTLSEGVGWIGRALAVDSRPSPARTKALWTGAFLASLNGDVATALQLLKECRTIAEHLDDKALLARITSISGTAAYVRGDYPGAVTLLEEALRRQGQADGVTSWVWINQMDLSIAAVLSGDPSAPDICAETLSNAEASGAQWCVAAALLVNGLLAWKTGDPVKATTMTRQALRIMREIHSRWQPAWCMDVLAWAAVAGEQYEHAAHLLGCARTLWRMAGAARPEQEALHAAGASEHGAARIRQVIGDRAYTEAFQHGADLTFEKAIGFALGEKPMPVAHSAPATRTAATMLTRREQQVAVLVSQGLSNKDIAATLVIARRTAEGHVEHILNKLGFTSRTQIASWITTSQGPSPMRSRSTCVVCGVGGH